MKRTLSLILFLSLFISAFSSVGKKQVKLRLVDTLSAKADEADVYLDVGISPAYIAVEDAQKDFDTSQSVPQIYSLTSDGVPCYSNGYGNFTRSVVVGLGFRVAGGSVYSFSSPLIDNFDPTTIVVLEDRLTGIFHDLRRGAYTVSITKPQQTEGRFYLHISYPPLLNSVSSGCSNNDGSISVTEDTTINWSSVQLFDSTNTYVTAYNNIDGNLSFANLSEGNYSIAFIYGTYSAVKQFYVGSNQIIADVRASSIYAAPGQYISFYSNASNATKYEWDLGDSTTITGIANVQYAYDTAGTYTITVFCSNNAGCSARAYITVYISNASGLAPLSLSTTRIIASQKNILITTASSIPVRFEVYNVTGQLIINGPLDSPTSIIDMSTRSTGIYFVRLTNAEGDLTRKLFLE